MRAAELQRYLRNHRRIVRAKLVSASADEDADIVEMDVDVDLPQRPLYRISQTERIRVRFPSNDEMPQVFALRKSFPSLPHLVLNEEEYPRQLCLYQRPWSDERENWAPRAFVERIRRWLAGTADGTLHPNDQPLEPVILNSPFRIALPEVPYVAGKLCRIERFFVTRVSKCFWVGQRKKPTAPSAAFAIPVIFVQGPAVTHGIIHQIPATLGDLEKLLVKLGGSLIEAISNEMSAIRAELAGVANESLMIVVELPKIRVSGGPVESVEHQAFIVGAEIGDLLKVEEVQVRKGRLWIPEKRELFRDLKRLQVTKLMPLSVRWHLSPKSAAEMNGYKLRRIKVVAIGAGSLGSQTINNLWRGGFGEWTLVDDDIVEPHNPARHLVNSQAVGFNKAYAMSVEMGSVYPGREAPAWIDCNYLSPGAEEAKLELALRSAELIVDLSASVAVERRLAKDRRSLARRISTFLNQRGDESVLLIEDSDRKVELVWLEAEYMRAVAFDSRMLGHFDNVETVAHRYANGCRDVSAAVAQDGVAIHAGLLSHGIRRAADRTEAAVRVNRWSRETGGVSAVNVEVSIPLTVDMAGWEVMVHREIVQQLDELRTKNLPNETGGILLGLVDRTQRFVAIVGMLSAPPDSEVWPTSFIRGSNGLARAVDKITKRTLGNVIYLGEWHSHPAGYDATPSVPDLAAIAICSPNTRADGLPTLMLIVATRELCLVLQPTDRDEIHVMKLAA